MARITFLGAAQTVTGSMHLLETEHARVLLDCGLFQGRRAEAAEKNRKLPFDPATLDAVVLSHAHIDHSGALPLLPSRGFRGRVFTTPATRDLADVMLRDAAMIQEADAEYLNRRAARDRVAGHEASADVTPLYRVADAEAILRRFEPVAYHRTVTVAKGVTLTFFDAGHVLGSAISAIDVTEGGATRRLVFTGDLGRRDAPILRDPETCDDADVVVMESTYGDRLHPPIADVDDALAAIVKATVARGGKIIIPSFALERAQEVLYALHRLQSRGLLAPCPIYVDSPLTVKITEVFRRHPECFDGETRAFVRAEGGAFEPEGLRYVSTVDESKAIDASTAPAIVISASGMCEAGRVLHHLRASIGDERTTIVIVGFQAQHTLGRRLVERRDRVRIFGVEHERNAQVELLEGFSAHADAGDLRAWARTMRDRGRVSTIALVHGEPQALGALERALSADGAARVVVPHQGDALRL